jgi:hypothetical protein
MSQQPTILFLLSSKSSGSSAFQSYVSKNFGVNLIRHTQHYENETLFWTKVASILGLRQWPMHRSEVPIPKKEAQKALQDLLNDNGLNLKANPTKYDYFDAFFGLCEKTGFPVIEKSPHHLFNESNINLILEFKEYIKSRANVVLIGLVRHPLATTFSAWSRWRVSPSAFERDWRRTYHNLLALKNQVPELPIFRYEEITEDATSLDEFLINSAGVPKLASAFRFKTESIGEWKDVAFRHSANEETIAVATALGYDASSLDNPNKPNTGWWIETQVNVWKYLGLKIRKKLKL